MSYLKIYLLAKFIEKTKMPRLHTLIHPQIYLLAKFPEKTKMPRFGTKNAWFGHFGAGICKQYCHSWNQHPQICLTATFYQKKQKCLNLGQKAALFVYFLSYNQFHNILRFFDVLPNFPFTAIETMADYYL